MISNESFNRREIERFRKELKGMLHDISEIDVRCLNKAVNIGLRIAKENTPVITGFMRRGWKSAPAVKSKNGEVKKVLVNSADYSSFVNYGHRIVTRNGATVGWVEGQFMLEKAINSVESNLIKEFKKEVERVNRKHDK